MQNEGGKRRKALKKSAPIGVDWHLYPLLEDDFIRHATVIVPFSKNGVGHGCSFARWSHRDWSNACLLPLMVSVPVMFRYAYGQNVSA